MKIRLGRKAANHAIAIWAVFFLALVLAAVSLPALAVIVNFPDPGLEAAIREAIGKPTGDIYDTDLAGLTYLDAEERNIASLEGIQYCVDLTNLAVSGNEIIDISPLSGLTNLTRLSLGFNNISDISALSDLTTLAKLDLESNQISDICPLAGLTYLTELIASRNNIRNINPLAGLAKLTTLMLRGNEIVDLSALAGVSKLEGLYLGANQVVDLAPVADLAGLKYLSLRDNQIVDISPLSELINLVLLDLSDNQIVDISPLSGLVRLVELRLYWNRIVDVTALSDLNELIELSIYKNEIIDIASLSGLCKIELLDIWDNQIADIAALSSLSNLRHLRIKGNQIHSIEALAINVGLGSEDAVDVSWNHLCLYPGSVDRGNIEDLLARGVDVTYEPQTACDETYPVDYVVAHWIDDDLDPSDPCEISLAQILQGIAWWATNALVPYTGGQIIDLMEILDLIALWSTNACIELPNGTQSLPRRSALTAADALEMVEAKREIDTEENLFDVTVSIEAKQTVHGLALDEELPEGWSLIPIENAGATFKKDSAQWLWLTVEPGDTLTIRYQLIPPAACAVEGLDLLTGTIRAADPSFEIDVVRGESTSGLPEPSLVVVAYPNPVRDVHTVTFEARGSQASEVERIRVEIYDVAGHLVYEGEEPGASIDWHAENLAGEYLASGVYVYRVSVRIGGDWRIEELKKLALLK